MQECEGEKIYSTLFDMLLQEKFLSGELIEVVILVFIRSILIFIICVIVTIIIVTGRLL